ncbi:helix-turn-helix domain-containing protein [Desemzia sp. FAM 23990]|uniref:helix-turn-helix domain-containing protein n=1 Tax=Desemzia sp. FAM 23990 TaxID=3259520 RepID=UPI003884F82A
MVDGHKLASLREKRGLSQSGLADALKVSQSTVAMWESNKRGMSEERLESLADFFNVSTDYLLGRNIPDWATEKDVMDLEDMLNSNVNMAYGGERLTEEEKQRVKDVLTGIFWEKLEKRKRSDGSE